MTFAVKNKERPKLIRFEEGRTIKDKILSMYRQKERSARTGDTCNIQHHTTHVLTFLQRLWWKPRDPRITNPPTFHFFNTDILLPYRHKLWLTAYWNIFISQFYYEIQHSSNFLKLTHSYQYNNRTFYFTISHTFSFSSTQLFEHFLFSFLLIRLLKFSLVFLSFDLQLCVLSLKPDAWYNISLSYRLELPKLCYHPWMAADEDMV